jgi:hypothetical protein
VEQVTANLSGKVRRETLDGRAYLVAPLSMIVPGVLAGSNGPLYYPADEVAKRPDVWNGMPITLRHPVVGGRQVSARRPDVLEAQGLGTVFDARHDGRLVAEGWFDEAKTRRLAPGVLASLESGRPIELSTGLYPEYEKAAPGSTHNGREYTHVARNWLADHLAVLPDQVGACSIKDGCGVLVNATQAKTVLGRLMDWAARALGAGDAVTAAVVTAGGEVTNAADGADDPDEFEPDAPSANAFCATGEGGGVDPSCAPGGGGGGGARLKGWQPAAGQGGSKTVGQELANQHGNKAYKAAREQGMSHKEALKWGNRAARAAKVAYHDDAAKHDDHGHAAEAAHQAADRVHDDLWEKGQARAGATRNAQPRHPGTGNFLPAGADVVPTDEQRKLGHDALVQKESGHNPPNWAVDEALWEKAKEQAAKAGHEEDWPYVVGIYQQMGGKIEAKPAGNAGGGDTVGTVTANDKDALGHGSYPRGGGGGDKASAHEASKGAAEASRFSRTASAPAGLAAKASGEGDHAAAGAHHEDAAALHRAEAARLKPGFFRTGDMARAARHEDAAAAHDKAAGMHKALAAGKPGYSEVKNMSRDETLAVLTANCTDEDRAAFGQLSDAALARLAGNAGMACPKGMDPEKWATMSRAEKEKYVEDQADAGADDADEDASGKKKGAKMTGNVRPKVLVGNDGTLEPVDETRGPVPKPQTADEWFAAAPPEIQSAVRNAVEIERRERTALVDRLVANAAGDAQARLRQRLSARPLDELRDMLAMLPAPAEAPFGGPQQPALYFGAAGGPVANAVKDDADNLLPAFALNFEDQAAEGLRKKKA